MVRKMNSKKLKIVLFLGSRVRNPWDPGGRSVESWRPVGGVLGEGCEEAMWGRGSERKPLGLWGRRIIISPKKKELCAKMIPKKEK